MSLTPVIIRTRLEALCWAAVDAHFNREDPRPLIHQLELDLYRAQAAEILERETRIETLVQLMRDTDPRTLSPRPRRLAIAK